MNELVKGNESSAFLRGATLLLSNLFSVVYTLQLPPFSFPPSHSSLSQLYLTSTVFVSNIAYYFWTEDENYKTHITGSEKNINSVITSFMNEVKKHVVGNPVGGPRVRRGMTVNASRELPKSPNRELPKSPSGSIMPQRKHSLGATTAQQRNETGPKPTHKSSPSTAPKVSSPPSNPPPPVPIKKRLGSVIEPSVTSKTQPVETRPLAHTMSDYRFPKFLPGASSTPNTPTLSTNHSANEIKTLNSKSTSDLKISLSSTMNCNFDRSHMSSTSFRNPPDTKIAEQLIEQFNVFPWFKSSWQQKQEAEKCKYLLRITEIINY